MYNNRVTVINRPASWIRWRQPKGSMCLFHMLKNLGTRRSTRADTICCSGMQRLVDEWGQRLLSSSIWYTPHQKLSFNTVSDWIPTSYSDPIRLRSAHQYHTSTAFRQSNHHTLGSSLRSASTALLSRLCGLREESGTSKQIFLCTDNDPL